MTAPAHCTCLSHMSGTHVWRTCLAQKSGTHVWRAYSVIPVSNAELSILCPRHGLQYGGYTAKKRLHLGGSGLCWQRVTLDIPRQGVAQGSLQGILTGLQHLLRARGRGVFALGAGSCVHNKPSARHGPYRVHCAAPLMQKGACGSPSVPIPPKRCKASYQALPHFWLNLWRKFLLHKDAQPKNFQRRRRDRLYAALVAIWPAGRGLPSVGYCLRHTAIHNRKSVQQQPHTR